MNPSPTATRNRITADELAQSMYDRRKDEPAIRRHADLTRQTVIWLTTKQAKYLADISRGRIPVNDQCRSRSGFLEAGAGTLPCGKLWSLSVDRRGAGRLEVFEGGVA